MDDRQALREVLSVIRSLIDVVESQGKQLETVGAAHCGLLAALSEQGEGQQPPRLPGREETARIRKGLAELEAMFAEGGTDDEDSSRG